MSDRTYGDYEFIKNPWPEWTAIEGGAMARQWSFEFERAPTDLEISSAGLGDAELHVAIHRGASPSTLDAITTTTGNALSDELFFFAFYRLFEQLEVRFGPLKTIQGQSRDLWRPFRKE